ncbi:unnamed protein product [Gongylonema pulchrum]|uniref:DUF3343 domain-containing protein n=1 Tax=Gongylonema pulchrum TaxID=637853 RepID=A0A183E970_9BILA|nr:unnamed protein product [Gongylonema pulchrum]
MIEIRVAGEGKQSEEHLRCLKSHFQGFPLFTIKYPTAGIGYVHGRNLLRTCDAAGLLVGFVDEASATTVPTI